jgi:preprotein translocase subunit YajC
MLKLGSSCFGLLSRMKRVRKQRPDDYLHRLRVGDRVETASGIANRLLSA